MMTYYVIGEPEYETSNWYRSILDGLIAEKRQRRLSVVMLENVSALQSLLPEQEDVIFIIGTNSKWLDGIIELCEARFFNRCIVLGNHNRRLCGRSYSIVTADIARDVRVLYGYLESLGCRRIALYGVNPESTSDAFKQESFLSCGGQEADIFRNNGSLAGCFDTLQQERTEYGGIICVNDYCAISLVRHLPESDSIPIVSCCGTPLSGYFRPTITGMRIDYEAFGKAGLDLSRILQKNSNVNAVNIFLASSFCPGETTDGLPLPNRTVAAEPVTVKSADRFYSDPEIEEMLRVEALLSSCEPEDLELLHRLLAGETYAQIGEALFMSTNGIKYKLKGLCRQSGTQSRRELVGLLQKYLIF